MTEKEQRLAIARVCGLKDPRLEKWCGCSDDLQPVYTHVAKQECHGETAQLCPDYCNDLNAMHEAEKVLTLEQQGFYAGLLHPKFTKATPMASHLEVDFVVAHATAAQRSEAFLRTLFLWTS